MRRWWMRDEYRWVLHAPANDGGDGAGGDNGGEAATSGGDDGDGDKGDDATRARREAQELRQRLKTAEQERDDLRNAQLTDKERAEKRAAEAEKTATAALVRLEDASLRAEVGLLAGKVGIRPDAAAAALKLIDRGTVTFDNGEAASATVEKALKAALKDYPFLGQTGRADAGEGAGQTVGKNDLASRINAGLRRATR